MTDQAQDADVVVIGGGVAGGLVAYGLAKQGISVLILEAGPEVTRSVFHERLLEKPIYTPDGVDEKLNSAPTTKPGQPNAYLINTGRFAYNPIMTKALGGTTWHWTASCERFPDNDFRLKSTYGVGVDWPIGYDDLEPYYTRAEHELGVSAPSTGRDAKRRSAATPMTDFELPYFYKLIGKALAPGGFNFEPGAFARNTRDYDGRPACRGNNTCWPICPIGAQYGGIVHINKARGSGAKIQTEALVTRLELGKNDRITEAIFRRPDGSQGRVLAKVFVLAANGLETPKLLLASACEAAPTGIANSSDQVGRNFMDHPAVASDLVSRDPVYPGRGPVSGGSFKGFDDGPSRRHCASAGLIIENKMSLDWIAGRALGRGLTGDALDREVRFRALRTFHMGSPVEMLPNPDTRITLDLQERDSAGQPRMRINFNLDDYTNRALDKMVGVHKRIAQQLGVVELNTVKGAYTGNHLMGATAMGYDRRSSVVDANCRSHDHPNLYIASSAVFPTSGGYLPPTLTIAALALRSVNAIRDSLKKL